MLGDTAIIEGQETPPLSASDATRVFAGVHVLSSASDIEIRRLRRCAVVALGLLAVAVFGWLASNRVQYTTLHVRGSEIPMRVDRWTQRTEYFNPNVGGWVDSLPGRN